MNRPEDKDPLDVLLREQNPHIDDDGFTARVLTALPPRRRAWLRPTVLLGATAIGSALASRWLPWENLSPFDLSALLSLNFSGLGRHGRSTRGGLISRAGWLPDTLAYWVTGGGLTASVNLIDAAGGLWHKKLSLTGRD